MILILEENNYKKEISKEAEKYKQNILKATNLLTSYRIQKLDIEIKRIFILNENEYKNLKVFSEE
jgi:hypothetical protein